MNRIMKWAYRAGLASGAVALASATVILIDPDKSPATFPQGPAETIFAAFGNLFMWLGVLLLISAIGRLRKSWHHLSSQTKVVSVLGLFAGTFLSAYMFYWAFRDDPNLAENGRAD